MKKINIIITVLFLLSFFVSHAMAMAKPKVLIDNPVYIFESVPEGTHVAYKFKIKNIGDKLLHITDVKPP